MNHSAEICRAVLNDTNPLVESVFDQIGISERVGEALVNKLCGDGTLLRKHDRLTIGNKARAQLLAEQARPTQAPEITMPPVIMASQPKPAKRELPIPTSIVIRKDVVCPPPKIGRAIKPCRWPFAAMMVGDSFVIEVPAGFEAKQFAEELRKDAHSFSKVNPGFRAAIRTLDEGKSVGVWREQETKETPSNVAGMTPRSLGIRARKVGKVAA